MIVAMFYLSFFVGLGVSLVGGFAIGAALLIGLSALKGDKKDD